MWNAASNRRPLADFEWYAATGLGNQREWHAAIQVMPPKNEWNAASQRRPLANHEPVPLLPIRSTRGKGPTRLHSSLFYRVLLLVGAFPVKLRLPKRPQRNGGPEPHTRGPGEWFAWRWV